ncbi:MAG TPA: flagellar motor protein MotB [Gemmataceae bacterium]|nr:flagellar motor protein MotB [Gemmataceae bacterium]
MLFGRKRTGSRINTDGWMMSYADMATILLAMFIVLSTLGKDQTGINLANGTGSFVNSLNSFGMAGLFDSAAHPIPTNNPTPHYLYNPHEDENQVEHPGAGDQLRLIDGEEEHLQHFLQELHRQLPVERTSRSAGQVNIDLYEPLRKGAPYLTPRHVEMLEQIRPLLERPGFRVHLVVWTPTPTLSAWTRAATQAHHATAEFAAASQLSPAAAERLIPLAQPWRYRDIRRPILSLIVVKVTDQ